MIKKIIAAMLTVIMIFSLTAVVVSAKPRKNKNDCDKTIAIAAGVITYLIVDDILDYIEYKNNEKNDYVPPKYPTYLKYPIIIGGKVEGYYITFNSNGGTTVASQYYTHNQLSEEPEDPVRNGYKFDGWYVDENCKIKEYEFDTRVTYGFTLYAKWIPN